MKKIKIKVTYQTGGNIDSKLDEEIKMIFDHIGAKWYAQGIDIGGATNNEREIYFEMEVDND